MQITIKQKQSYGRDLFYPACDISEKFAALVNAKTLSESNLRIIKEMGYQINVTAEKKEF